MRKLALIIFIVFLGNHLVAQYANNLSLFFIAQNYLTSQSIKLPVTKHKLVVIAHRGSHVNVPENTLAAYENAIKEGADYVEIDLRTTKDGRLVIMHDESVNRTTGKNARVKDLNYNEIINLKVKPTIKEDTAAYRVPDFESVLKLCKGKINIYLDFKDADVELTYKLIKQSGMQNNVVVYLNKEEQYSQWKNVAPQMPLMSSLPEKMNNDQLNEFLDKRPLNVVDNAHDEDLLNLMLKRKIAVWLDVQSKDEGPQKWELALKQGVSGLQTDQPGKLVKYLEDRGIR